MSREADFPLPEPHEYPEAEGLQYVIRPLANLMLSAQIDDPLKQPTGGRTLCGLPS